MITKIVGTAEKLEILESSSCYMIYIEGLDILGNIVFSFHPDHSGKASDWKNLLEACEDIEKEEYFCKGPHCLIGVSKHDVSFEVMSSGDGAGGQLCLSLPKQMCVDAFRSIYHSIIEGGEEEDDDDDE